LDKVNVAHGKIPLEDKNLQKCIYIYIYI